MGQQNERRSKSLIFIKFWIIRILIGSSIAFIANKIDNYMDKKIGPGEYDKIVIEAWNNIKEFF